MHKQLLTAVSALAILAAAPAMADTQAETNASVNAEITTDADRTANEDNMPTTTEQDIKQGWENTKKTVSDTANDVADATERTYNDIKASLLSDDTDNMEIQNVAINTQSTASGMIGQPVINNGERVGKIRDIIVDGSGTPTMVIVGDGDFFGLGKLAAFDYSTITGTNSEGDVIAPLTENAISQAAEFSYEPENENGNIRVIPSNGYSVAKLLDGQLVDSQGETLAQIEDIQFQGGSAAHLVVSFDQVLGLGGKNAAISYDTATVIKDGDEYDFQVSADKAVQFENFKKTSTN